MAGFAEGRRDLAYSNASIGQRRANFRPKLLDYLTWGELVKFGTCAKEEVQEIPGGPLRQGRGESSCLKAGPVDGYILARTVFVHCVDPGARLYRHLHLQLLGSLEPYYICVRFQSDGVLGDRCLEYDLLSEVSYIQSLVESGCKSRRMILSR